ncbi:MAG: DMT family transporter, partial [Bacteroidia bacterium]
VNSTSWAIFVVMVKPIMMKYNTVTAMRWMFLFGSIYILPIGLHDTMHTNWAAFTGHAVFAIIFVVVATTFFAYLLNIYGLQSLSPSVVSMYIYLQPFLATTFAIALGKDTLTPTKIFSGVLIICGLYLVNFKTKKSEA